MERLQKVIAHAGIASRRKAEQLILEGKVTVNDKVVRELGVKVTGKEKIEVEGIPLQRYIGCFIVNQRWRLCEQNDASEWGN